MAEKMMQSRPSLIGSNIFGESIAPREEPLPSGEKRIISPIDEDKKGITVKTTSYKAIFGADGSKSLEGPIPYRERFKSQTVFRFDVENNVSLGTGNMPQKERFFVEANGDRVRYGSRMHPDIAFTTKGEVGRLSDPYIEIGPELAKKVAGDLGDKIRREYGNAGTWYAAAKDLQAKMEAGEKYREGSAEGKGFGKNKPGVFVRLENEKIIEFGPKEHSNEFSFGVTKDGGFSVIINPQSSKALRKRLGENESGVVVGMVHDEIPHFVTQINRFTSELDRLKEFKEVAEFLEKMQ